MKDTQEPLETLSEIRDMMERSSKFISLSGLSGVSAGIVALAGAGLASMYKGMRISETYASTGGTQFSVERGDIVFSLLTALGVFVVAVSLGIFFSTRKARRLGLPIWDATARRLVTELAIPLAAGAAVCLLLLYHEIYALVPGITLVFYGLGLINAGKYTLNDIRLLGAAQIILGLVSMYVAGNAVLFWSLGFGILHIVYGIYMYIKYER